MSVTIRRLTGTPAVESDCIKSGDTAVLVSETELLAVDHLDLWTLPLLIRARRSGARFASLSQSSAPLFQATLRLCHKLGWDAELLTSPYADRRAPGAYVDLSGEIMRAGIFHLQPDLERRLETIGITDSWERTRTARFLTLANFKPLKRCVEVLEAARRRSVTDRVTVWVQKCGIEPAAEAVARSFGVSLRFYRAAGRWRMPPRAGFFEHEIDRWPPAAAAGNVAKVLSFAALSCIGLLRGWFGGERKADDLPMKIDVVALLGRNKTNANLDDLFWIAPLKDAGAYRVALIYTGQVELDRTAADGSRADSVISLRRALMLREGMGPGWTKLRRRHLAGILSSARRVIGALARGRLPVWIAGQLLAFQERIAFYEAFMDLTGARLGWCMQEGHEINAQAIAVAAHRRDGVSLGTSWSLKTSPCLASSNNRNDITFVWGARQRSVFMASAALSRRFVSTGYPMTRRTLMACEAKGGRQEPLSAPRRLCFYDNVAGEDTVVRPKEMVDVYRVILRLATDVPGWQTIIKAKRDEYRRLGPEITEAVERAVSRGFAVLNDEHGDLAVGLMSNVVIGHASPTLPLLAAQHGVMCVLYDPEGVCAKWPVLDVPNLTIAETLERFEDAVRVALRTTYAPSPQPGSIDAFADADGDSRVAFYIETLARAFRAGKDREKALACADARYGTRWGVETVVTP